jgi:hypothetical protein
MLDRNLTEALAPERSFRDDEWMTGERREALRAICDTVVGAIEQTRDPHGFWARSATDVGTDGRSSRISARCQTCSAEACWD